MSTSKSKPASMKTYSRRVNSNLDGPSNKRKREEVTSEVELPSGEPKVARRSIQDFFKPKPIALESLPSSSSVIEKSSDPAERASTPPSSPPPIKLSTAAQRLKQHPKRRLSARSHPSKSLQLPGFASHVENEESEARNASKKSLVSAPLGARQPLKAAPGNLQQVQLDLGVSAMKQCKACGMEYNSTISEDRKLHDDFHKRKLRGMQPVKMLSSHVSKSTQVNGETYEIRTLDCRGPVSSRPHFEQALETMYADLSGDQISSEDLWSEIPNPIKSSILSKVPRFTIFMLLIDRSLAAILIVERITQGGGYLDDYRSSQGDANVSAQDRFKAYGKPDVVKSALMSVERVWVDRDRRRKGLASMLISHARKALIPGLEVRQGQVAFSWPTTLGRALATRFSVGQHDEAIPFLVNLADCPNL